MQRLTHDDSKSFLRLRFLLRDHLFRLTFLDLVQLILLWKFFIYRLKNLFNFSQSILLLTTTLHYLSYLTQFLDKVFTLFSRFVQSQWTVVHLRTHIIVRTPSFPQVIRRLLIIFVFGSSDWEREYGLRGLRMSMKPKSTGACFLAAGAS